MKNTKEILIECDGVAKYKTSSKITKTMILAFFAGLYISFGALASLMVSANFIDNSSLSKLLAGAIFPVGLMLIMIAGGELFTGNCLIFEGVLNKTIKPSSMFKNLIIVWLFNFLGALFLIFITTQSHMYYPELKKHLIETAVHKAHYDFLSILLKGIGCNILVAVSVFMSYGTKDMISKIFIIFFPIMTFIILGFDHVVANMYYIPAAMINGADISILDMVKNLTAATIGNFIGGSLVIIGLYHKAYCDKK